MERRRKYGKKLKPKHITGEAQKAKKQKKLTEKQQKKADRRATKLQVKHRATVIHEYKIMGYNPHEILRLVNEGGVSGNDDNLRWGITYGQCTYYSRISSEIGEEILKADIKGHYEGAVKRWGLLIRKFHKEGDNTNLVKATKELDELLNLRKTNINISGLLNTNDVTDLTGEALDIAIAEAEKAIQEQNEL